MIKASDFYSYDQQLLLANLSFVRSCVLDENLLLAMRPCLHAYLNDSVRAYPFALLIDLILVLTASTQRFNYDNFNITNSKSKVIMRAYEDNFLRRLQNDKYYPALKNNFNNLTHSAQITALVYLINQIFSRLQVRFQFHCSLASCRELLEQFGTTGIIELVPEMSKAVETDLNALLDDYFRLAQSARQVTGFLTAQDLFLVAHIEILHNASQRFKFLQVIDAAELISQEIDIGFNANHLKSGNVASYIVNPDRFPSGGFSSISNAGGLENLVSSELIYMDANATVDVFSLRYLEKELLYYTRDDHVIYRRVRKYAFIFDASLTAIKIKHKNLPYQDIVLVIAVLLSLLRLLIKSLGKDKLHISLIFTEQAKEKLRDEYGLMQVVFSDWINCGLVQFNSCHRHKEVQASFFISHDLKINNNEQNLLHLCILDHIPRIYHARQVAASRAYSLIENHKTQTSKVSLSNWFLLSRQMWLLLLTA